MSDELKRSNMWCQVMTGHTGDDYLSHFAPHSEVAQMYSPKEPVYAAVVEEAPEAEGCYWAWWDNKDQRFTHVYHWRGAVEMCFPYGPEVEEKRGRGKVMSVKVTLGEVVPKEKRS